LALGLRLDEDPPVWKAEGAPDLRRLPPGGQELRGAGGLRVVVRPLDDHGHLTPFAAGVPAPGSNSAPTGRAAPRRAEARRRGSAVPPAGSVSGTGSPPAARAGSESRRA